MISRRNFLGTAGAATVGGGLVAQVSAHNLKASSRDGRPLRLAIITTVWRYLSHAQHMGDRFLVGYPHEGAWHHPDVEVVSLFVDQRGEGDQSDARANEFGFKIYPTVAEALRQGGEKLAVDAVLIIGEHGDYPRNPKGQILYPRYKFFKEVVKVFREDRKSVPVFNDKHLSFSFDHAQDMVRESEELGFPFMAGSSLPVTFRLPSVELPFEAEISDALMVGVGSSDPMDFHALEALQCLIDRRKGGETGVEAVQLIDGKAVWSAGDRGEWSWELLEAALSRSNELQGLSRTEAKPQDMIRNGQLKELAKEPAAYHIWFKDGLKTTLLMLNGAVGDFTCAVRLRDSNRILSTLFYLPPTPNVTYSAELMNRVEGMFQTGVAGTPVKRTLLVSGVLESCLESRLQGGKKLKTPHLAVEYRVPAESPYAKT
jgi:hypothetical protein